VIGHCRLESQKHCARMQRDKEVTKAWADLQERPVV